MYYYKKISLSILGLNSVCCRDNLSNTEFPLPMVHDLIAFFLLAYASRFVKRHGIVWVKRKGYIRGMRFG